MPKAEKTCINGEEEIRSQQKEINGFGRIQEIEQKRQTEYQDFLQTAKEKSVKIEGEDINLDLLQFEKDSADSKPYITDSRAYYNIHNNRIGLLWKEKVVTDEEMPADMMFKHSSRIVQNKYGTLFIRIGCIRIISRVGHHRFCTYKRLFVISFITAVTKFKNSPGHFFSPFWCAGSFIFMM
jgi:hypothetical protein